MLPAAGAHAQKPCLQLNQSSFVAPDREQVLLSQCDSGTVRATGLIHAEPAAVPNRLAMR
jgi:predicted nucleic acid-binding Zn ribbon protein